MIALKLTQVFDQITKRGGIQGIVSISTIFMEAPTFIFEWIGIRYKRKDQSHNVGLQAKKPPKSIPFLQCFQLL